MTVDDLVKVYCDAFYAQRDKAPEKGITEADRAGVTAIVRALRDETRHMTLNRDGLEELFTQILGSDAEEKVAEGIAERADEQRADAPATDPIRDAVAMARGRALVVDDIPILNKLAAAMKAATDAAPAVCVWTDYVRGSEPGCAPEKTFYSTAQTGDPCPSCGKPIAFKEAK